MSGKQVLGVDPGIHGGLALVDSPARQIIDSIELPVSASASAVGFKAGIT